MLIFYILNKALWDYISLGYIKYLYYGLVFFGAMFGMLRMLKGQSGKRKYVILYFLYSIYVLINGFVFSNSDQRSVGFVKYITYPLVFFSLYYYMNGKVYGNKLLRSIAYWGTITSIFALFEYVRKAPILPTASSAITIYYNGASSYRASVFCVSPMILAVLLAIAFNVCVYLYRFEKKSKYLAMALIIVLGVFSTGSRAPFVSMIMGLLIMYYYIFKEGLAKKKTYMWFFFMFVVALIVVFVLMAFPNIETGIAGIDNIIKRFSSTFDFNSEWGNVERLTRWGYYLGVFFNNPIFGIGLATTSAEVATNINITAHGITTESGIIAHLVETGLVGTVLYYIMLYPKFGLFIKKIRKTKGEECKEMFVVVAALVVFLIEDMVLQISLDIFCNFILWFFAAYGVTLLDFSKVCTKRGAVNNER
jgi:hypothetical protein